MENKLKHDILTVVSMGVMVKRRALNMLHPSEKYIEKCVAEMYADKLIRRAPHRIVRLGQEARTELAEDEWNLYLALSNNDAPGCDKLHVDAYVRASDFLCMAYAAGIITQFYRVPMIRTKSPELTDGSDQSVAVLRRDLKIEGQKQQRVHLLTRLLRHRHRHKRTQPARISQRRAAGGTHLQRRASARIRHPNTDTPIRGAAHRPVRRLAAAYASATEYAEYARCCCI